MNRSYGYKYKNHNRFEKNERYDKNERFNKNDRYDYNSHANRNLNYNHNYVGHNYNNYPNYPNYANTNHTNTNHANINNEYYETNTEENYRNTNYKKILCQNMIKKKKCIYTDKCLYAHSLEDQSVDKIRVTAYDMIKNDMDLSDVDLVKQRYLYSNLVVLTKLCEMCENGDCTGGYNCKHGACDKIYVICQTDLNKGLCKGNCGKVHLTEKGLVPYWVNIVKNTKAQTTIPKGTLINDDFFKKLKNMIKPNNFYTHENSNKNEIDDTEEDDDYDSMNDDMNDDINNDMNNDMDNDMNDNITDNINEYWDIGDDNRINDNDEWADIIDNNENKSSKKIHNIGKHRKMMILDDDHTDTDSDTDNDTISDDLANIITDKRVYDNDVSDIRLTRSIFKINFACL